MLSIINNYVVLSVVLLSIIMLKDILLRAIMLSVHYVTMLSVTIQGVIMLSVITLYCNARLTVLSAILHSTIMLCDIMPRIVILKGMSPKRPVFQSNLACKWKCALVSSVICAAQYILLKRATGMIETRDFPKDCLVSKLLILA
jgi:hypothetical protein